MTSTTHKELSAIPPKWHASAILRRKDVEQITGLSRSSIYAGIQNGTFPLPIRLSAKSVGWLANEIETWIQEKIDQRKETSPST